MANQITQANSGVNSNKLDQPLKNGTVNATLPISPYIRKCSGAIKAR